MSDGNQNPGILIPTVNDCKPRVRQALQDIIRRLGTSSTPTYSTLTLDELEVNKLVRTDSNKSLAPADINDFVDGTTNQINKTNDGDGTMTLSTPQDIHAGASITFAGLTLTDFDGILQATNGVVSVNSELTTWLDDVTLEDGGAITTEQVATFAQVVLTPRTDAISAIEGAMFYDSDDKNVYVCLEGV